MELRWCLNGSLSASLAWFLPFLFSFCVVSPTPVAVVSPPASRYPPLAVPLVPFPSRFAVPPPSLPSFLVAFRPACNLDSHSLSPGLSRGEYDVDGSCRKQRSRLNDFDFVVVVVVVLSSSSLLVISPPSLNLLETQSSHPPQPSQPSHPPPARRRSFSVIEPPRNLPSHASSTALGTSSFDTGGSGAVREVWCQGRRNAS